MIRLKVQVYTNILMDRSMTACGEWISNMEKEGSTGLIRLLTKEIMKMERSMDKERSIGQMGQCIRANLMRTTSKVMEYTSGPMAVSIMASGTIIRCMDKESSHGLMEEGTKETTCKTKSRGMELSSGLTVKSTLETGMMGDNMDAECISCQLVKREKVNGKMEKELSGQMKSEPLIVYSIMCG
jgi:hypothetical protein